MGVSSVYVILAPISAADYSEFLTTVLWCLVFAWLFWFGGSVGSFMNVVVYRLPAGINLVYPGSRCPRCQHAIRWYHNLPIAGWLMLRGRCRDCGSAISSRYPLVEAFMAILFVGLAAVEVLGEGANLPPVSPAAETAVARGTRGAETTPLVRARTVAAPQRLRHPIADTPERVWGMYAFHLLLASTLVCAALIELDGHAISARVFLPALAGGFVAPLFWPELRAVPLSAEFTAAPWARGLAEGSAGLVLGGLLGAAAAATSCWATRRGCKTEHASVVVAPLALGGLFFGWQTAAAIAVLAALLRVACLLAESALIPARRFGWTACITAATLLMLFVWGPLAAIVPWFGPAAGLPALGASFIVVALASAAASRFKPPLEKPVSQGEPPVTDQEENLKAILNSPNYRLAEFDTEFLARPELRPVRMQLELLKTQMALEEQQINSTIVTFGGTAIVERHEAQRRLDAAQAALAQAPDDALLQRIAQRAERVLAKAGYYDDAREFGRLVSSSCQIDGKCDYVIITGGGPGIMEAANRGAFDVGAKSIGLNVTLPAEQAPNPYITPQLCFQFHYFALRKMHFLMRAKALVVFPGGFGTLDELTDALTLRQTERMQVIPIIMYGREYWRHVIDFQFLADEGVIADEHLRLIHYADTPEEAWRIIAGFHRHPDES